MQNIAYNVRQQRDGASRRYMKHNKDYAVKVFIIKVSADAYYYNIL